MNGIQLYETPKKNIFEWRKLDYIRYLDVVKQLVEYTGNATIDFFSDIPTDPDSNLDGSIYRYAILKINRNGKEEHYYIKFLVPIEPDFIAFQVDGKIRIPILQSIDDKYFTIMKDSFSFQIRILSNFMKLPVIIEVKKDASTYWEWNVLIRRKKFPLAFALLFRYKTFDDFMFSFGVKRFKLSSQKLSEYPISVKLFSDFYLNMFPSDYEYYSEIIFKQWFKYVEKNKLVFPFKDYRNKALKQIVGVHSKAWKRHVTFKDPYVGYSILDTMYELISPPDLKKLTSIKSNPIDLTNKRFRMMEHFTFKLYSLVMSVVLYSNIDSINPLSLEKLLTENITGQVIQYDNSVNPISQLAILSRVTYAGKGGFESKQGLPQIIRNIDNSYKGILDPLDTSSSSSAGLINYAVPENFFT